MGEGVETGNEKTEVHSEVHSDDDTEKIEAKYNEAVEN